MTENQKAIEEQEVNEMQKKIPLKKKRKKQLEDFVKKFLSFIEKSGIPLEDAVKFLEGNGDLVFETSPKKIKKRKKTDKDYVVTIQEIFINDVNVKAKNADDAVKTAIRNYYEGKYEETLSKGEIVLKYVSISSPDKESTDFMEF